ncbi:hypothetical protein HMPREF1450_00506 [Helicobacter pylori HP260ASii]|uniref:Uncharacterized protein n=1 Tax=Helicobacter pylori HP260AFii TaxID=1159077 RepID=A0ABC9S7I4_HELPX|nr:hypothetical protein HMPREF1422_01575 [Helicobacter pylori GAM268Bii]EMH64571.1 hypothetical protein HMPREF1449_01559 [Helicobacter pylori HP260AFii]EMH68526.1 hypothetical protein HMPREF1450_00506 [Helicobacter pylori HP260ASii]
MIKPTLLFDIFKFSFKFSFEFSSCHVLCLQVFNCYPFKLL